MRLKSEFLSWLLFFFSSRRRHTRFKCDWSSDVCSSDLNGQLADRGAPSDYDEWEQKGAQGWGWNAVLPYFKKVERDMDFDGPWHGKDGRIPVRRILPDNWCGHAKAAAQAFKDAGYDFIEDQNGEYKDGYFPITISNLYDRRVSAAIGYLDNGTRRRPNLKISAETQVSALLFEGTRCVGVKALVQGRETEFRANEVIVSSGAIHSPAHLLRAGIGRARVAGLAGRADRRVQSLVGPARSRAADGRLWPSGRDAYERRPQGGGQRPVSARRQGPGAADRRRQRQEPPADGVFRQAA